MITDLELTTRDRQRARAEALLEHWDGLRARNTDTPKWVMTLALQLELWVGTELREDNVHYEITYDYPPADAQRTARATHVETDALSSTALYIRALTDSFFVAVDVSKPSGQPEPATVSMSLIPRSQLTSLAVEEVPVEDPRPNPIQLVLTYANGESFTLPRRDGSLGQWRSGEETAVLRALQKDLWLPPLVAGRAVFPFHS